MIDLKKLKPCQACGGENWTHSAECFLPTVMSVNEKTGVDHEHQGEALCGVECDDCGHVLMFKGHEHAAVKNKKVRIQAEQAAYWERNVAEQQAVLDDLEAKVAKQRSVVAEREATLRDTKAGK